MNKKDINNWIMYLEIHKLSRMGFNKTKIARFLVLNIRTVNKYLGMSEEGYEQFLLRKSERNKKLSPYESFVLGKLEQFPDTSAAQIHDWLKEYHPDFPEVGPRTVYNFVMFVRQKYNIPYVPVTREYFPIEELPYGEQAQVDFGEYNMRMANGKRKKVRFFAMVLSRSRMKYVHFSHKPFTSQTVVYAHERAFEFFQGIPKTVVYDQDRTMVVDENIGDIILTSAFKSYTKSRSFKLHFCRKADPESKGKVENVIQYVKKNFLYNRPYFDIENLNKEALGWLRRTANHLAHNFTKKSPKSEFMIEKEYLNPFVPLAMEIDSKKKYYVRKTNAINYKSNFYTLPMGTFQGSKTQVLVEEKENRLVIYNLENELICSHPLSSQKGKTISNTNHKRDTSMTLKIMMEQTANSFTDHSLAGSYLQKIKVLFPRYIRDHLQVIIKALKNIDNLVADKALVFCIENSLFHGHEFEQVVYVLADDFEVKKQKNEIKPMGRTGIEKANQIPQKSKIEDYERIINQ